MIQTCSRQVAARGSHPDRWCSARHLPKDHHVSTGRAGVVLLHPGCLGRGETEEGAGVTGRLGRPSSCFQRSIWESHPQGALPERPSWAFMVRTLGSVGRTRRPPLAFHTIIAL